MSKQHSATRVVAATPDEVWALLGDPTRHGEADASGMVLGAVTREPLTEVGQVFTMEVVYERESGEQLHYRTDNLVDVLEPGRAIGWRTGEVGRPPSGWAWRYLLRPVDEDAGARAGATEVTLVYDWTDATPEVVELVGLPAFGEDDLARSLASLAAAVER